MAQLQFKGKTFVQNHHLLVKYHELIPVKAKSLTDKVSLHDNLIIHGDNLKALKALLPLYAGKVKCVYIDPPYNTGNEGWAYNDNVSSPMMQEWLGKVVDREDLTRHDKWLCMITPRLKLLRELMTEDGAMFVSIDDNEIHRLRMLMDEIFGEDNFMAQINVLVNPKGRVMSEGFAQTHEYLLVYRKTPSLTDVSIDKTTAEVTAQYTEKENEGAFRFLELRNTHRQFGKHNRPNLSFTIYCNPKTGQVSLKSRSGFEAVKPLWDDGFEGCWTWNSDKVARETDKLRCRVVNDKIRVYRKAYAFDEDGDVATRKPTTTWTEKEFHTEKGQMLVDTMFGTRIFYAPKPLELIKRIVQIATDKESLVLDSFSGSGTTGHAVLSLNSGDGGNRRFILIQCNEHEDGKPKDICDTITAERIRRVIKGVPTAKDETLKKGLGGTFSFFKLGKPLELESILDGDSLPTYEELARYVFYTATGEEFDPAFAKTSAVAQGAMADKSAGRDKAVNKKTNFVGESRNYQVFLFYEPDVAKLKNLAFTLDMAKALPKLKEGKRRLVFAPTKYLDQEHLDQYRIDFAQLPFEIYELTK